MTTTIIIDGYKFTIETNNANNILLEKTVEVSSSSGGNIISAIRKFILFLHKSKIQYVTIWDCKGRDRYTRILQYIYRKASVTERKLLNQATFIWDEDVIRCKVY